MKKGDLQDFCISSLDESDNSDAPILDRSIQRRTFLGAAGVAIATLLFQHIDGGIRYAWADETNADDPDQWTVFVIRRWETAIVAVDPTVSNADGRFIADVNVTLTSLYNNKEVTGKTDAKGRFVVDLRGMTPKSRTGMDSYTCMGKIIATKDGYRVFETRMDVICGGSFTYAATQKLDAHAYVRTMSFDDYDIQYAKNAIFPFVADNDDDHTFTLQVAANAGAKMDVSHLVDGKEWEKKSVTAGSDGLANVSFTHQYLRWRYSESWRIAPGSKVAFKIDMGTYCIDVTSKFATKEGIDGGNAQDISNEQGLSLLSGNFFRGTSETLEPCYPGPYIGLEEESVFSEDDIVGATVLVVPKDIPIFGGAKLDIWLPTLPVYYDVNVLGKALFGIQAGMKGSFLRKKDGEPIEKGWKRTPDSSVSKQWQDECDKWSKALGLPTSSDKKDLSKDAPPETPAKRGKWGVSGKLEFTAELAAFAGMEWDWSKHKLDGKVAALASVGFATSITLRFHLGPVPAFIGFDGKFGVSLNPLIGFTSDYKDFVKSITWHPDLGIIITPSMEVGVTAGIGMSGVASISVRGFGQISFSIGLVVPPGNNPYPHLVANAALGVQWAIQLLLLKASGTIWQKEWKPLWENWSKNSYDEDGNLLDYTYAEFEGVDENLSLVTNSELALTAEIVATQAAGQVQTPPAIDDYDPMDDTGTLEEQAEAYEAHGLVLAQKHEPIEAEDPFTYEYSPSSKDCGFVEDAFVQEGADGVTFGIAGIGKHGVKPSSDVLLFKNVFSNPQIKIVSVAGNAYLLRILNVQFPGNQIRSRLTISKWDGGKWTKPQVLNIAGDSKYKRLDMFDYDFDCCVVEDKRIHVILTCGMRPNSDASTIKEIARNMLILSVICDPNTMGCSTFIYDNFYNKVIVRENNQPVTKLAYLYCPRITPYENYSTFVVVAVLFGEDQEPLRGDVWYKNHPFTGINRHPRASGEKYESCAHWWDPGAFTHNAYAVNIIPSVLTVVDASATDPNKEAKAWVVIYALSKEFSSRDEEPRLTAHWAYSFSTKSCAIVDRCLQGWPSSSGIIEGCTSIRPNYLDYSTNHGKSILAVVNGKLMEATNAIDGSGHSKLEMQEFGPQDCNPSTFTTTSDGKWVFYSTLKEGKKAGPTTDDKTMYMVDMDTPVLSGSDLLEDDNKVIKEYHVKAMKLIDGKFTEPFCFAEMDRAIDSLDVFALGNANAISYKTICDLKTSRADIHLAAVPHVKNLTILRFESVEPVVCAGNEEPFNVTVMNNGNTLIQSFTLVVTDKAENGKVIAEKVVRITADNTTADQDDVTTPVDPAIAEAWAAAAEAAAEQMSSGEMGALDFSEDDTFFDFVECDTELDAPAKAGVLVPGRARRYRVEGIKIPEDWRGEMPLFASIKPNSIEISTVPQYQETDDVIGLCVDGPMLVPMAGVGDLVTISEDTLSWSEEIEANTYSSSKNPVDPKVVPKTGDYATVPLAGAAGIAGIGAAAIAAYSARRVKLEHEQELDGADES